MYIFRGHTKEDIPFIHSSWWNSYHDGTNWKRTHDLYEFDKVHRPIREAILDRHTTKVSVCVSKDNPSLIIGWVAFEEDKAWKYTVLHYMYVKEAFKGLRLASQLVDEMKSPGLILYTHVTEKADRILKNKKLDNFSFTPRLT